MSVFGGHGGARAGAAWWMIFGVLALLALGPARAAVGQAGEPGSGGGAGSTPPAPVAARPAPINVVCTTGMVADLVRNIGGERVKVEALMRPGVDPHLYKPTRSDIAKLNGAEVVFYSGLLLEGKMTETFTRLADSGKPVFSVTQHLGESDLITKGFEPGAKAPEAGQQGSDAAHQDPHVWMNPRLWKEAGEVVLKKLAEFDPAGAQIFATNHAAYTGRLLELDAYAQETLALVPEKSRVLLTAHDAFGYFGKRYGYQVEGIQGISTESEAGVRDIQRLIDIIVDRDIRAVFIESSVSDRNIKALVAGAKAKGKDVKIGGELFSDAMGPEGTYRGTYIGMIDHNVTTIARALGAEAPAGGFQGLLVDKPAEAPSKTPAPTSGAAPEKEPAKEPARP